MDEYSFVFNLQEMIPLSMIRVHDFSLRGSGLDHPQSHFWVILCSAVAETKLKH